MRKSLVIMSALLIPLVSRAQIVVSSTTATSYTVQEPRQTGLFLNLNTALSVTSYSSGGQAKGTYDAGLIVGWQLTPNLGFGLGAAYKGGENRFGFANYFHGMYSGVQPTLLPVFATARLHLTSWRCQPFIGIRAGMPFGLSGMENNETGYYSYQSSITIAKGRLYFAVEAGQSYGDFDVNLYYEKYTASLSQTYLEDDFVWDERTGTAYMSGFGLRLAYNLRPKKQ